VGAGGVGGGAEELGARRRQRAEALLRRSAALVQCALELGEATDEHRVELQSLYTSALGESKRLFVESPWCSLLANASGLDTHRDSISSRFDCRGPGRRRGDLRRPRPGGRGGAAALRDPRVRGQCESQFGDSQFCGIVSHGAPGVLGREGRGGGGGASDSWLTDSGWCDALN
jgi:hypothetical protein